MLVRSVLLVAVLVAWTAPAGAEEITVTGRVVDAIGVGVANARIDTHWSVDEGLPGGATTDAQGAFSLTTEKWRPILALIVTNPKATMGAVVTLDDAALRKPVTIKLETLIRVQGRFTSKRLGRALEWTNVMASLGVGGPTVASCGSWEAGFTFHLPPGTYHFHAYGQDVSDRDFERVIEFGRTELDLGTFDLAPTPVALLAGKPLPPWTVTAARGAPKTVQLSDYKGKWVLLEFWFST